MLRRLVEFALSQRLLMLVLAALLAAGGGYAFSRLPIDAYPDISTTQVKLILKAPGMTPEEVEQRVIAPLELELLGIPNQVILRSIAKYAIADITIDFTDTSDVYWARQQVGERLSGVMSQLPDTVSGGLAPIATPLSEIFMFTIEGGTLSPSERRTLLDWTIRPALRTVPGVADVNALGGHVATFEVVPNDAALLSAHLRISDLRAAIEQANRNDGAGRVSDGEEALIVRAVGAIRTLDDLREVMVGGRDGGHVRLGDVAEVKTGSLTRYGAVTRGGAGEAVEGLVLGLRGADTCRGDCRTRWCGQCCADPSGAAATGLRLAKLERQCHRHHPALSRSAGMDNRQRRRLRRLGCPFGDAGGADRQNYGAEPVR